MAFGGFQREGHAQPMAEINVTPLVDVMLVLLVIFIITAPLLSSAIKLDLPTDKAPPVESKADAIKLSVDSDGKLYWNNEAVSDKDLPARFRQAAAQQNAPELQLRADKAARYERISFVMATAQQSGIAKIGFVTEPVPTPPEIAAPLK